MNLLTEAQAAEQLHVCPRTVRRLRQSGAIRYVAITPRTILYRPEDLAAYIEQQTQLKHCPAPTGRVRPSRKRQDDGNVVSFTARRAQRRGTA